MMLKENVVNGSLKKPIPMGCVRICVMSDPAGPVLIVTNHKEGTPTAMATIIGGPKPLGGGEIFAQFDVRLEELTAAEKHVRVV